MSLLSSVFKGGSQLALGQVASQACSFLRNLIIARVVSPADFGIAATFAMTLSLMEMISNVASEMLLVQSPEGNDPKLQATAQLMKVVRGITNAIILLLLAVPMSHLFGVPQATWAFACLAIYPLLMGFSHLDTFRVQREMRFMPSVQMTVGSNLLVTAVTLPLVFWLRNYSVMLWVLVLQALFTMVISHIVAERRYSWTWDKRHARSMFHFGWPLLINGLLMYGIFEGDRLIIGSANRLFPRSHFTLADLGVYSVAFALTMAPTMVIANISTSLFLPLLSQAQEHFKEFEERYLFTSQLISITAILITLPLMLSGGWVVTLLYGPRYAEAATFIAWLAAMWGFRIFRVAPTVAAIAKGDTQNAMFSNLARSLALVGMIVVAAFGGQLMWIPACGLVGEILATAVTIWRLWRRNGVRALLCLRPGMPFFVGMALAAVAIVAGATRNGIIVACAVSVAVPAVATVSIFLLHPHLLIDFRSFLRTAQRKFLAPRPVVEL
jgi:O-antigen/teichoic acid export membrane protein